MLLIYVGSLVQLKFKMAGLAMRHQLKPLQPPYFVEINKVLFELLDLLKQIHPSKLIFHLIFVLNLFFLN